MFQLVNLIFSSRECGVKFASVINVALGFLWFSLLLYNITVLYNINHVVSFLSCIYLRSLGLRICVLAHHHPVNMPNFIMSVCFICTLTQTV